MLTAPAAGLMTAIVTIYVYNQRYYRLWCRRVDMKITQTTDSRGLHYHYVKQGTVLIEGFAR